jgi:hypothetical protein
MSERESKYGIKETADLVTFIAVGVTAAFQASRDGFSLSDAGVAFSLLGDAKEAFVGMKDIPQELSDLDDAEVAQVVQIVSDKLVLPESKASEIVPYVLRMAPLIFAIIRCVSDPADVVVSRPGA